MTHTYYTSQRYARISGQYAADAIQFEQEANQLTGQEREIAELSAKAARELSRWHAIKSHAARQTATTEEGEN